MAGRPPNGPPRDSCGSGGRPQGADGASQQAGTTEDGDELTPLQRLFARTIIRGRNEDTSIGGAASLSSHTSTSSRSTITREELLRALEEALRVVNASEQEEREEPPPPSNERDTGQQ